MEDRPNGRIVRSDRSLFLCKDLNTQNLVSAKAKGTILKNDELVVGDFVYLKEEKGEYFITQCMSRRNEIFRTIIREGKKRVTASNIDLLGIVVSCSLPKYKRGIVERYLVRAHQWGIPCAVIFNKFDQWDKLDLKRETDYFKYLNVESYVISAKENDRKDENFLDYFDLKNLLNNKTALFVGQSGVGKSVLVTSLSEGKVVLKDGEINRSGKGGHTTTWSELVDCGNFWLVDSPGIRSFSLEDVDPEELLNYFPLLHPHWGKCRYNDCSHNEDCKGCFFQEGDDDFLKDYLRSYLSLQKELGKITHWERRKKYLKRK